MVKDIQLSVQEQYYYEERFDNAVVAFKNLKISATVGEGSILSLMSLKLYHIFNFSFTPLF